MHRQFQVLNSPGQNSINNFIISDQCPCMLAFLSCYLSVYPPHHTHAVHSNVQGGQAASQPVVLSIGSAVVGRVIANYSSWRGVGTRLTGRGCGHSVRCCRCRSARLTRIIYRRIYVCIIGNSFNLTMSIVEHNYGLQQYYYYFYYHVSTSQLPSPFTIWPLCGIC